jgi:2-C-methyl-D-erythritol 4-phosphate cytidylyltransferase
MSEAWGVVPLEGRGSLPFLHLHHEMLFLHAVRALLEVGTLLRGVVVTIDDGQREAAESALASADLAVPVTPADRWWRALPADPVTAALHDPLCPLVPPSFLSACIEAAGTNGMTAHAGGQALVAFRPVTDTIKTVVDDHIVGTLDRDRFGIVASPVVFPHGGSDAPPPTDDFGVLAAWLRSAGPVELRKAPSLGRRVDDPSAVNLLECMDEMARAVRQR